MTSQTQTVNLPTDIRYDIRFIQNDGTEGLWARALGLGEAIHKRNQCRAAGYTASLHYMGRSRRPDIDD